MFNYTVGVFIKKLGLAIVFSGATYIPQVLRLGMLKYRNANSSY